MEGLTEKQRIVAALLLAGYSDKEMAYVLGISLASVKGRLEVVHAKLGARHRIDIVLKLWRRYGRAA